MLAGGLAGIVIGVMLEFAPVLGLGVTLFTAGIGALLVKYSCRFFKSADDASRAPTTLLPVPVPTSLPARPLLSQHRRDDSEVKVHVDEKSAD